MNFLQYLSQQQLQLNALKIFLELLDTGRIYENLLNICPENIEYFKNILKINE